MCLRKALVADDDRMTRAMLKGLLENKGYLVTEAEDGQIALDNFKSDEFELVVLDWMMPNKDGFSAMLDIRDFESSHRSTRTYILMVTSKQAENLIVKAILAGADSYIKKPVRTGELVSLLEKLAS